MTFGQKALCRAVVLTVGISFATAQSAQATLLVAGTANGVNFCVADNNFGCAFGVVVLDEDPTLGSIRFGSPGINVGGVLLSGGLSTATISPSLNILNTSSFRVTNATQLPVSVTLVVGATFFASPTTQIFTAGSGIWQNASGSAIQLSWYQDPANSQGAETPLDRPGTELSVFDDSAKRDLFEAFATDSHQKSVLASPFSLTLAADLTLVGGGTLLSLGQAVGTAPQ